MTTHADQRLEFIADSLAQAIEFLDSASGRGAMGGSAISIADYLRRIRRIAAARGPLPVPEPEQFSVKAPDRQPLRVVT